MRAIKLRGKKIGSDKWLFFDITHHLSDDSGVQPDFLQYQLDTKTIGQFTGFYDYNGKEIYEGDIMPYHFNEKIKGIVKFGSYRNPGDDIHSSHIGFYLEFEDERAKAFRKDLGFWIKITFVEGNIHETPELLNQ